MVSSEDEMQRQLRKRKHKRKKKDLGSGDESGTPEQMAVEAAWNQLSVAYKVNMS